jgi:hypothetical protein
MIISKDAEKIFGKTQHLFKIKALNKLATNKKKAKYYKPTVTTYCLNIQYKAFPVRSGSRQRYLHSPLSFLCLRRPSQSNWARKKGIQTAKEDDIVSVYSRHGHIHRKP